jgi:hypothetical protein
MSSPCRPRKLLGGPIFALTAIVEREVVGAGVGFKLGLPVGNKEEERLGLGCGDGMADAIADGEGDGLEESSFLSVGSLLPLGAGLPLLGAGLG